MLQRSGKSFRMMRIISTLLFLFCSFIMLDACSTLDEMYGYYRTPQWSSSSPMSIPYSERLKQFQKNNLVINSSFEDGRIQAGNAENAFLLRGWEKVGSNVEWVTQKFGSDAEKAVYSGTHAVKIVRKQANELDEPEGIISSYIPVIPGNYYFSYRIKLNNITNNKYRLGVQLYDAVVIKVLFFDENKEPLDPQSMNPVSGTLIDNSDKGYSFSNYWRVDDFDWGSVRGRSYNYPFSEGDIPDKTRFVRLFFGLKGTGTMWLDDVEYRYSKWNFTTLERFKPYFTRTLTLEESIIPTPKSIHRVGDIVYFDSKRLRAHLPVIVLPENPAPADFTAAKILKKKIVEVLNKTITEQNRQNIKVRVLGKNSIPRDIFNNKLMFSIGRNIVYQKVQPDLPLESIQNKPQGYIIKAEQIGNAQIVFLMGNTPLGDYYAAATAVQLLENDECIYHNATVIDYPDFLGRSYVFKDWQNTDEIRNDLNAVERMSLFKLNKVYMGHKQTLKDWNTPDALCRRGAKEAGTKFREIGVMGLAVMLNPYSHFAFEAAAEELGDQLRYTWTHASIDSFNLLKGAYKIGLDAGADTIMLRADDFVPHTGKNRQNYTLYTEEDKKRFVNLQNAQAHIINRLKQWTDKEYPGTRIEFCPPWYANEHIDRSDGKAELYFKELTFQIPREIAVIWTGPTIRSLSIDMADLRRYRSLIGRWPMLWDNTLYARNLETKRYGGYPTYYPGKVRMCNLFEPYDTFRPDGFQKYNDGRQMYTNGAAYSEVYRIKYATVADYEWNTSAYNPELALWKVLCKSYGSAGAKELIRFNDAYYRVYEMCLRMENEGIKNEYIKKGKEYLNDLNNCLLSVSKELPGKERLLSELKKFRDRQNKRFNKLPIVYNKKIFRNKALLKLDHPITLTPK